MSPRLWPVLGLLLACGRTAAAAPAPDHPTADARAAVERALPFLERDGLAWMAGKTAVQGGAKCVSCHHVGFALWSHREARRAGLPIPATIDALDRQAHASFAADADEPRPVSLTQLILGRGQAAPAKVDLDMLAERQPKDGHWEASGQFPTQDRPRAESDAVATMWALLAVGAAGEPGGRAVAWLKANRTGESTEWLAARLAVAGLLGEPADQRRQQLLRAQRADGGWGWTPAGPSNAFSTGQALYALAVTGATDPAVARAVAYLCATQRADGTWATPSKLVSTKPTARRDYIYQYWGTGWAAIGLARLGRTLGVSPQP